MTDTVVWLKDHAWMPSGFKNASIGTAPPEISLKRLASPREASLRPAKRLRRCHSEQSAAAASSLIERPLSVAQRSIGCRSDMGRHISPRNHKSQPEIFPVEIVTVPVVKLEYGMGKAAANSIPTIYLGDWLAEFDMDNGDAAAAAGCDQSYISNIVAGRKTNINVLFLLRLSEAMGVTINDFYRKLPNKAQLAALKDLSPKAQATLLARFQKKA